MRPTLSAFVLVASFGCGFAEDAKKAEEPKKAETKKDDATPEQEFKDLQKAYSKAMQGFQKEMQAAKPADRQKINDDFQPKHEKMAKQFLDLGKANLKADFAIDALMMATQDNTTDAEAIKLAVENFADSEKILPLVPSLPYRPGGDKILSKLAESKNKKVRGGVKFIQFNSELEKLEGGEPGAKAKTGAELDKAFAAAGEKLAGLVKEYGDVEVMGNRGPVNLAEAAKDITYMMENLRVGKVLGDVEVDALVGGKKAKISDYRNKVVLLDIWATWCGPCRAMIPHERKIVEDLKEKPFALISVSADDEKETLEKFLEKEKMPWTHWHAGAKGDILKKYQINAFPTLFLLDGKGTIRYKWIGSPGDKVIDESIELLLKEMQKASK